MTADRIDARDAYGDEYALVKGAELRALELQAEGRGAVAGVWSMETQLVAMDEDGAVQTASFLGRSVSPAACRDLLAELAPLACSDDLPAAVRDFLVGEAPPLLKKITAEGVARGTVVRSLIELGRALGRAEEREKIAHLGEVGTCDACHTEAPLTSTGAAGAVSLCLSCLETSARDMLSAERAKLAGLVGAARNAVDCYASTREPEAIDALSAELAKLEGGA